MDSAGRDAQQRNLSITIENNYDPDAALRAAAAEPVGWPMFASGFLRDTATVRVLW